MGKSSGAKNNYSFRLSDEAVKVIDAQQGATRTEKFENLVFSRQATIAELDRQIAARRTELAKIKKSIEDAGKVASSIEQMTRYLSWAANYAKDIKV